MLFRALKSRSACKCSREPLHLLHLRVVVRWTNRVLGKIVNVLAVKNIASLPHASPSLSECALAVALVNTELRKSLAVVVVVGSGYESVLGLIENSSDRMPKAPTLLE